jgi:hypothetical protein
MSGGFSALRCFMPGRSHASTSPPWHTVFSGGSLSAGPIVVQAAVCGSLDPESHPSKTVRFYNCQLEHGQQETARQVGWQMVKQS